MQVSGLQHPWYQHGFSTPGPRRIPVFWSAPRAIGVQGADALQSADEGGQSVGGRPRRATPQRVHRRYILALTCDYLVVHDTDRACVARTGRTRAGRPGNAPNPGLAAVTPTRRHHRPGRPYTPALATMPYGANAQRGPDLERACPRRRQWHSVPRVRRAGGDVCCRAVGGDRKGGAELMPCG
jgi:hypothetical protein